MMPDRTRHRLYLTAAWLMPLAVLLQIGLALFGIPLPLHAVLGAMIALLVLILIRLVPAASTSHSQRVLAMTLAGLIALQPCLIALRPALPALAALHAVNAFVILGIAVALAFDVEDAQTATHARSRPGGATEDGTITQA